MNPCNLKNNALFLSCWYERSRPIQVICFGILILSIILLSFLTVSTNQARPEVIWKSLFYIVAVMQGVVLLVQGTMFASHMGSRERTSETLDFHRNSPEPVEAKVIGLIFGSTWFEWVVFLILFIVELFLAPLADISIIQILLWNVSLVISGIFFHTTGATVSLLSTQKKRGSSPFAFLLLFLFFGGPFIFYYLSSSFFSHLSGATALQYICADPVVHFSGRFYTLEFPLVIMQIIVQVPLFLLIINGMKRIFRLPNSPAWSKEDVIRFCCFLFFMVTGFFVADYAHIDEILADIHSRFFYPHNLRGFLQQEVYLFSLLFVAVGIMVSFFCVPSYFKCSKYLLLSKKGSIKKTILDDGATSFIAIIIYVAIGGLFAIPYLMAIKCPILNGIAYFLMLSSYVVAFAGFLEFFRLGKFRNNTIFLVTTMLVWWVFIPWMVTLILNAKLAHHVSSISPFWGLGYAVSLLWKENLVEFIAVIVPCIVAGLMWLLAWQEHSLVEKQSVG